jgi:tRNA (adenine22-N1)-methyltransferase
MNDSDQQFGAGLRLSRRLSALAELVPQGARLADIGTDHALLPVFLAGSGRVSMAIAGDVNAGPVEAAKRQVKEAGLEAVVSVRLGDGLAVVGPGEVDTVSIAGMGGSLMVRILDQGIASLEGVSTLILSPHVAEDSVRRWLVAHRYMIDWETLVEEDGVIYSIIRAVKIDEEAEASEKTAWLYDTKLLAPRIPQVSPSLMFEMGPLLMREPSDAFHRKWEQEILKRERVILQLSHTDAPEAAEKAKEWQEDVREILEVLACLPVERRLSN